MLREEIDTENNIQLERRKFYGSIDQSRNQEYVNQ